MGALEKWLVTVVEIYRRGIWMRPGNYLFCVKFVNGRVETLRSGEAITVAE
jgi:hypothetical protein